MLDTVFTPPPTGGRPKIAGTILADAGTRYCVVCRVFSGAANAGNTGSPATEVWVALSENMTPVVVRRSGVFPWRLDARSDHAPEPAVEAVLARLCYRLSDVWPGNLDPDWPVSVWDRRVVVGEDDRWPRGVSKGAADAIRILLKQRNDCADVWAVDAQILGLALRL